jgi:Fur family ferric uptake transcriptional regulator
VTAGADLARERADAAVSALRARGERVTHPRRAVIDVLAALPGHPTAEQVVAAVEASDAGVHRATVYRVLEALTALEIVSHVHVGHGGTSYHLADPGHLHAHCGSCGSVVDLPVDLLAQVRARLLERHGFALDASHIALSGRCRTCRTAPVEP